MALGVRRIAVARWRERQYHVACMKHRIMSHIQKMAARSASISINTFALKYRKPWYVAKPMSRNREIMRTPIRRAHNFVAS